MMIDDEKIIYTVKKIREIEALAINKLKIPEETLMKRAGESAYQFFNLVLPGAKDLAIVCGKGNNAGDGYVFARAAQKDGKKVTIYSICNWRDLQGTALAAAAECQQLNITIEDFNDDIDFTSYDAVIDALLGIGIKGNVKKEFATAINKINDEARLIFSMDIPSGLDADTGAVLGTAIEADVTMTFIGYKQGLLTHQGKEYAGEVECLNLDLPDALYEEVETSAFAIQIEDVYELLPDRPHDSHKGDYGHVLIVGGDYGMAGAVAMAGEAAARVGAGLVSIASRPEHLNGLVAGRPELMCHGISEAKELKPLIEKATVIVLGPGLGNSEWSHALFNAILATDLPLVVDASALQLLADAPVQRDNWILTPHPGEAAYLLDSTSKKIQCDRFAAAKKLQKKYSGVIVLKGSGSIVQGQSSVPMICDVGNPGMATGGMGDVLSGILGGLLAQKLSVFEAACAGAYIHSRAADEAAEEGERGILATDLMPYLQHLINYSIETDQQEHEHEHEHECDFDESSDLL